MPFKADLAAKLAPATVNRHLALLRSFYYLGLRNRTIEHNPMRGIKLFREENTRVRYLTEEKEFRLLQTLPGALPSPRNLHLHDPRHTWASRLTMAGVDPSTIKRLGDWKTLAMVQRYAQLSLDHKR